MKPLFCSLLLLFAFSLNAQAPVAVPIPKEPHHHLVLENDYVRVFRVSVPAHEATLLHQHDVPYVYIALGPADVINAVQDKPEVRLVMADGQVGYSRGGFAHIARTDAGLVFNNVTIELLHPQGEPRNLCEKIIDGPLNDCQNSDANRFPSDSLLRAPVRFAKMEKLFETDELLAESVSLATKASYIRSGLQPSQLLIALDNSEVQVDVHGKPPKSLHSGEVLWLVADNPPTIVNRHGHGTSRFLLLSFKN
jgi:hypothetical protein